MFADDFRDMIRVAWLGQYTHSVRQFGRRLDTGDDDDWDVARQGILRELLQHRSAVYHGQHQIQYHHVGALLLQRAKRADPVSHPDRRHTFQGQSGAIQVCKLRVIFNNKNLWSPGGGHATDTLQEYFRHERLPVAGRRSSCVISRRDAHAAG
jgi:hypothetical protein